MIETNRTQQAIQRGADQNADIEIYDSILLCKFEKNQYKHARRRRL